MGAAVEISTGTIAPEHLAGKHVMLGTRDLGVFDGSSGTLHFEIPSGKHVLFLKDGLTTSGAVAFRVQAGHCAQIVVKDSEAGIFSAFFGGWFALERSGDHLEAQQHLEDGVPGAEEISPDEVPVSA
ncbi:hypothetical protein AB4028_03915 [Janibacter sp. RAF20_2_2]|uniref:hypothetical protein n=1 Tax=unclassified Janibacter TaxID=2649294 RepID=UPI003F918D29